MRTCLYLTLWACCAMAWAAEPVALRAEHLIVPPATGPVTHVLVRYLLEKPYEGTVRLAAPEGWTVEPAERTVTLKPGETARVPFTAKAYAELETNAFPVEVAATGSGATVVRKQTIVCASAPVTISLPMEEPPARGRGGPPRAGRRACRPGPPLPD